MSHGVHIQVTIPTSEPDSLKSLASESLFEPWGERLIDDCNSNVLVLGVNEAYEFLDDLRNGRSFWKWGNEGDVFMWGMVGNHSNPVAFVDRLMPFWNRIFEAQVISHEWQKALIIYTHTCALPESGILEVGWDDPDSPDRILTISHTLKGEFTCF